MLGVVAELKLVSTADNKEVSSPQVVADTVQLAPADGGSYKKKCDHVCGEPRAFNVPLGIACELPEPMNLQTVASLVDKGPLMMMGNPEHGCKNTGFGKAISMA